jgi:hypothetical protein
MDLAHVYETVCPTTGGGNPLEDTLLDYILSRCGRLVTMVKSEHPR